MKTIEFLKYSIYYEEMLPDSIFHGKTIINTINPHSYCIAKKDHSFRTTLKQSNFLLPDGIGIVFAIWFLTGRTINRKTGSDLHEELLMKLNKNSGTVFYLGSDTDSLVKIHQRVEKEHQNIIVRTFSPSFDEHFSDQENELIISTINDFKPDVLFIGMTAPKQEKWVAQHKEAINAKVICSVGAVFDFYSGKIKRPKIFWQKTHLEWFRRLITEPKRLWHRNFISTPRFLWSIMLVKLGNIAPIKTGKTLILNVLGKNNENFS